MEIRFGRRGAAEKGLAPHSMEREELALYNSGDARLTALAWNAMQADLEVERKIYEHDKELSVICQQMHIDGIRMDVARRDYLSTKMEVGAMAPRQDANRSRSQISTRRLWRMSVGGSSQSAGRRC